MAEGGLVHSVLEKGAEMKSVDAISHHVTDMSIGKASLVQKVLNEALEATGMDLSLSRRDCEETEAEDPTPSGSEKASPTGDTLEVSHVTF